MKKMITLVCILCCFFCNAIAQNGVYNAELAKRTGADPYGMKSYVMALIKTGKPMADTAKQKILLSEHLKNISRLANEGKLVVAGPMMDNTGLEGIFVFNVKTIKEAEALSATDPAVQAGLFTLEYHPWYATAALMEIVSIHKTLQQKSF